MEELAVPFVAAWPGTIPAGSVQEHPVVNLDVAATANSIPTTSNAQLDGVNLLPYMIGQNKTAQQTRSTGVGDPKRQCWSIRGS